MLKRIIVNNLIVRLNDSGLEEQYLDRLITCRHPCKSDTRNKKKNDPLSGVIFRIIVFSTQMSA